MIFILNISAIKRYESEFNLSIPNGPNRPISIIDFIRFTPENSLRSKIDEHRTRNKCS